MKTIGIKDEGKEGQSMPGRGHGDSSYKNPKAAIRSVYSRIWEFLGGSHQGMEPAGGKMLRAPC